MVLKSEVYIDQSLFVEKMSFFKILHVNKHNLFEHNFLLKMLWLLKSIKDVQETHYCVCKRKFVVAGDH